jgi:hypothetical protein
VRWTRIVSERSFRSEAEHPPHADDEEDPRGHQSDLGHQAWVEEDGTARMSSSTNASDAVARRTDRSAGPSTAVGDHRPAAHERRERDPGSQRLAASIRSSSVNPRVIAAEVVGA